MAIPALSQQQSRRKSLTGKVPAASSLAFMTASKSRSDHSTDRQEAVWTIHFVHSIRIIWVALNELTWTWREGIDQTRTNKYVATVWTCLRQETVWFR